MTKCFPIWYFLECYSERFQVYVHLRTFEFLLYFFHVIYLFGLSVMFFFFPNCFASFAPGRWCIPVHSPPTCRWNFLSSSWKVLLCLYSLTLSRYLLGLPSFAIYLFTLHCQTCLLFCFDLFIPTYPCIFSFPLHLCLLSQFFYVSFKPNFPSSSFIFGYLQFSTGSLRNT